MFLDPSLPWGCIPGVSWGCSNLRLSWGEQPLPSLPSWILVISFMGISIGLLMTWQLGFPKARDPKWGRKPGRSLTFCYLVSELVCRLFCHILWATLGEGLWTPGAAIIRGHLGGWSPLSPLSSVDSGPSHRQHHSLPRPSKASSHLHQTKVHNIFV